MMRAPRVALLIRRDQHWREWARLALQDATRTWGGEGFAFIPYDPKSGSVDEAIQTVVHAWDPDHIISMSPTLEEWARISPEDLSASQAASVTTDQVLATQRVEDEAARVARDSLIRRCSPLRTTYGADQGHPTLITFEPNFQSRPLMQIGIEDQPALAASSEWTSDAALYAGVRLGVAPHEPHDRPEPTSDELLRWLIDGNDLRIPDGLLWFPQLVSGLEAKGRPRLFRVGDPSLEFRSTRFSPERRVYVVGDEAEDFALAVLLDRMVGDAVWLSRTATVDEDELLRKAIESHALLNRNEPGRLSVTSASLADSDLADILAHLQKDLDSHRITIDGRLQNARRAQLDIRRPDLDAGRASLMITDQLPTSVTVPVSVETDGTMSFLTPIVSPIPSSTVRPQDDLRVPYWLVDVLVDDDAMPPGRIIHPHHLVAKQQTWGYPVMRRGRDGFTFDPCEQGLVVRGQPLNTRLVRMRLRVPSAQAWVRAVTEFGDVMPKRSLPGTQADLLATRLGGRRILSSLVKDFREVLAGFAEPPRPVRSDKLFPDGDGVLIGRDPYLTFAHMTALAPHLTSTEVRTRIDQLVAATLMWPGLILRCQECARLSFQSVETLATRFTCPRCGAENPLASRAWGGRDTDPAWHYDLHPVFRELMHTNGDVPLLAAEALLGPARLYDDTAETVFMLADGSKVAEADLIAVVDGIVHAVEAKSNGTLGTGQTRTDRIRKLVDCVEFIHADRLLLATTQPSWNGADVELVTKALESRDLGHVVVQTLEGLGRRPDPVSNPASETTS